MKKLFRHVPDLTRFIKGYFEIRKNKNKKFENVQISNTLIDKKPNQDCVSIKKIN